MNVTHSLRQSLLALAPIRPLWETAYSLTADADLLRLRRYGMIEVVDGELSRIVLRPYPKLISAPEVWWDQRARGSAAKVDACRLYYDQPLLMPNFLALKYIASSRGATYASCRRALQVLDQIARIKQTDAMVCEGYNLRLSDRLATRFGWERHCLTSKRRHFIKRFYGNYAAIDG